MQQYRKFAGATVRREYRQVAGSFPFEVFAGAILVR
jgi:hypothetical protein